MHRSDAEAGESPFSKKILQLEQKKLQIKTMYKPEELCFHMLDLRSGRSQNFKLASSLNSSNSSQILHIKGKFTSITRCQKE